MGQPLYSDYCSSTDVSATSTAMKRYDDVLHDGGSSVIEQIKVQQSQIHHNLSGIRHIIAIASGKGGVGKSTLTIQIARTLQSLGKSVGLLDCDFNGPTLATFSGCETVPVLPSDTGLIVPTNSDGLKVLSLGSFLSNGEALEFDSISQSDSFVWRSTKEFSVLREILAGTNWGNLDYLLVDLPPGAEKTFQFAEFFGERAAFVLVTIPSEIALKTVSRSYSALKRLKNNVLGYIVNMDGYRCSGCEETKPLFPRQSATAFQNLSPLPKLGSVPFDPAVTEACDRGRNIDIGNFSGSALALESFRQIAQRIIAITEQRDEISLRQM